MSQVSAAVHFSDTGDHWPPRALARTYTTTKANGEGVLIERWLAVVVVEFALAKEMSLLHSTSNSVASTCNHDARNRCRPSWTRVGREGAATRPTLQLVDPFVDAPAHTWQFVCPTPSWNFPTGHAEHDACPGTDAYSPGLQLRHPHSTERPRAELAVPAEQFVQSVTLSCLDARVPLSSR